MTAWNDITGGQPGWLLDLTDDQLDDLVGDDFYPPSRRAAARREIRRRAAEQALTLMPAPAITIIRTYAAEVTRLRSALRALDEWCPSNPPEPLRSEVAELLAPGRRAPVADSA